MAAIITTLIATRNRPNFLKRAISSLQAQTCPHWQALILDASDNKDTVDMLEAIKDNRLMILHFGIENIADVFNPILEQLIAAKGFCCWMCDNVEYAPRAFEIVVQWFHDNPKRSLGYVFQERDLWTPDGLTRTGPASDSHHWNILPPGHPCPIRDGLGILDQAQVFHRLPTPARWKTPQELHDRRVDGHFINALIEHHGPAYPISDTILSFEHMAYRE